MTERNESSGGDSGPPPAREFEQGDKVLGRCTVDRCVRRDRLASFNTARDDGPDGENLFTVWSVHAGIVHRSERASTVFFDEMQAGSGLSHPSIPAVVAFDPMAPGPVVIARFVQGVYLRDRLAEGELLNAREVSRIVLAVAEALATLHRASPPVFHRAVTPERVLSAGESVFLEECGYLHAVLSAGMLSEKELETFAQPGYRLPSKVSAAGGAAIDRFQLAVLAFEALTGQLPFGAATVTELDDLTRRAPSARSARPTLPAEIDDVFRRAWSSSAADAYATTTEFAADLARVLEPREAPSLADVKPDVGATIFSRPSQRPDVADDIDRALDAALGETPSEPSPAQRKLDVERLLPMVSAALQANERTSSVPPERRSGMELPPLSRALDLPPSKPTLLGAATGSAKGSAPFSVRPAPISAAPKPGAAPPADAPEPGSRESRPLDLTDEAELQDRLSQVDLASDTGDRSVVELDEALLEPSTTNTNLQRIMDEIASFRPAERSPMLEQEELIRFGDPLDDGVTRTGQDEELVRGERAERVGTGSSDDPPAAGAPPQIGTLRAPAAPPHSLQAKKTPLPALPPLEGGMSRGTPLSSIAPVGRGKPTTLPPADPGEHPGSGAHEVLVPRPAGVRSGYGKAAGLPTTTPPPTRLNTPIPMGAHGARPTRRSVPPGAVTRPAASAPPMDEPAKVEPAKVEQSVVLQREPDALAMVAPTIAKLTALASLIATVGLIFAARQLDAYMADPGYSVREPLRADPLPPVPDAGAPVDDLGVASSIGALDDAAVELMSPATMDAAASDAVDEDAPVDATGPEDAGQDAGAEAVDVVATAPEPTPPPRRPTPTPAPAPANVPGDAVHARVWSQLSRRIADCVEGVDSHTSVTILVRFDGPTGMVRRIRSRGIFAEPPIGPCIEQAATGIRVTPFGAPGWDTTFSFPIAPPRWRPPQ